MIDWHSEKAGESERLHVGAHCFKVASHHFGANINTENRLSCGNATPGVWQRLLERRRFKCLP
jgi:hypothetical protein